MGNYIRSKDVHKKWLEFLNRDEEDDEEENKKLMKKNGRRNTKKNL